MTIISGVRTIKESVRKRMAAALRIVVSMFLVLSATTFASADFLEDPNQKDFEPTAVAATHGETNPPKEETTQMYTVPIEVVKDSPTGQELLEQSKGRCLGTFCITHYCPCAKCNGSNSGKTATGRPAIPYNVIAVDPNVIPLGSSVYIDDYGLLNAYDTGSGVKGHHIDVMCSTHEEAIALGVKYLEVYEINA